jgi:DNA-binding IclR family transcriptional regulator
MLKQTQLLKAKLEESRRAGYQTNVSRLRPGQECIMVVRPWEPERVSKASHDTGNVKRS